MSMPEHMQVEDLEWHLVLAAIAALSIVSWALGVYGQSWVIIFALVTVAVTREMPLNRWGHITVASIIGSSFTLGLLWSKPLGTALFGGAIWASCLLVGVAWEHIAFFLRRSQQEFRERL